jgi:heat shock protein HslJ/membrane-bound inhibitor of C-type lysozyme
MTKKFLKTGLSFLLLLVAAVMPISDACGADIDEISVALGNEVYIMRRVSAESGEKYEAQGDEGTAFWINGAQSVLTIKGREYTRYVLLMDTSDEDEFIVIADGKNYTLRQVITASGAKYEEKGNPETFFWSKGNSVTLCLNGKDYKGYDYWLPFGEIWIADQSIPTGIEWKAVSIDREDVIAGSNVTVTFHADGKVSGIASVNNYTAPWMAYGNKIIISDGISTKKAGLPDMMDQEDRFLEFLRGVDRFIVQKDCLRLINKNGGEIVLTR